MYQDTSSNDIGTIHTTMLPKARRSRKQPNWTSRSTSATLRKQASIQEWLSVADEGMTVTEIGQVLGISRQLALYHVKKLAAARGLVMVLEPCEGNGGLQYKVWDATLLARSFISQLAVAA